VCAEARVSVLFSEPKIPQNRAGTRSRSYPVRVSVLFSEPKIPQTNGVRCNQAMNVSFSALQRAENSSKLRTSVTSQHPRPVSVLFSEPKIPQTGTERGVHRAFPVSVLFSEPKIPQTSARLRRRAASWRFSALQRAENSSKDFLPTAWTGVFTFQCSSASRKFLKCRLVLSCAG